MPDTKISALPSATALAGTEVLPVVQSATTCKTAVTSLGSALGTISKYRNAKKTFSTSQTLNTSTVDAGDTVIHTGSAVTYTLPQRLAGGDTAVTEGIVIQNRGTGIITLSASSVTIKGATSVAIDATCSLEWETNGTTHWVWSRTS